MAFGNLGQSWAHPLKTNTTMAAAGRSGHLAPHRRTRILQQHGRLQVCKLPSKCTSFWGWLERVYGPQNTPMLWWCIVTIIKEVLRAKDPLISGEKHIRLLRGLHPINWMSRRGIWGWFKRVYGPQNTLLLWWCIITIIKEHFEGHRPSQPQRKTYPLAQGIVPYQLDVSAQDLGVVGEGLWPSKQQWPWWWGFAVVSRWLSVAWCLRQHKSTMGVVHI
jgi:hypothetical protein